MRLTHRRAGWALAAAGSFGLTLSGLAQQPVLPGAKTLPPVPAPLAVADVAPSEARLVEIKVELAWLGDGATFPCQLAARKVGSTVEVGGCVPTEALRLKALEVAKKHCTLPIVDKLVIHPGSALPMMTSPHDHLCQSAAEVLTKALADNGETFEFSADASGELTVSGTLKNWEEKLNVSRRLSMIPGCTSVVNNFDVKDVVADGKAVEYISADGKLRVPATTAVAAAPKPQPAVALAKPVSAPVVVSAPQTLPPTATPPAKGGMLASLVNKNPAPVVSAPQTLLPAATVSTPAPAPTKPGMLASLMNKTPAPAQTVTTSVVTKEIASNPVVPPTVKPTAPVVTTAPAKAATPPVSVAKAPAAVPPVAMAAPAKPVVAPKPTGAPASSPYGGGATATVAKPVAPAPKPTQTVQAPVNNGIKPVAYQAPQNQPSGIVQASYTQKATPYGGAVPAQPAKPAAPTMVAQAPKPVAPAALPASFSQAPVLKPAPAAPAVKPTAAVTALPTAPAIKPVTATAPAPGAAAMTPAMQGQLLQRIHEIGGAGLQDARMHSTGRNDCVIQVTVRSRAEGQEIGQKILKMPELVPYKVDLKVEVAQPNPAR